jgi:hypothetical protein
VEFIGYKKLIISQSAFLLWNFQHLKHNDTRESFFSQISWSSSIMLMGYLLDRYKDIMNAMKNTN